MPFTSGRGFSVPATSSLPGTWGSDGTTPTAGVSNALNQGVTQLLDQALSQTTTKSLSSSNVVLTQLECQSGMYRFTGTLTGNCDISATGGALWNGIYCWENVTTGSFSVTITNSAGSVTLPQGRRGLMWLDTVNGPRITAIAGSTAADPIPTGYPMIFYSLAAPSGWTAAAVNDFAIRLVNSGTTGGTFGGAVAFSTVFGQTTTGSHALTLSEIPSHSHSQTIYTTNSYAGGGFSGRQSETTGTTGLAGGGDGHTHTMDMRVLYLNMIMASRN